MSTLKPFHESIVDVLRTSSAGSLPELMDLLRSTKIPGNHEKIISALYDLFIAYNNENDEEMEADEFNDLAESIREQKREAEEEARLKKEMEDRLLLEDAVE